MDVKLLVLDFDGTLTDNKVYTSDTGIEYVCCSKLDSVGIWNVKNIGINVLVLSNEENDTVLHRCMKMGVECAHGVAHKLSHLKRYCQIHQIHPKNIVYVGNDVNDIECMEEVGISFHPSDAHQKVKDLDSILCECAGGNGAVREVCDWIVDGAVI